MASEIKVDTISEKTSAGGVTIDGLLIKDGGISGDVSLIGTTPTFTIGDAGAEDATLLFDGNAQDFHIGLDDTTDDLVIGVGSTLGTTTALAIDENAGSTFSGTVTVGVDDTGKDVKLFGATSGKYWLWDESADGVVQIGTHTVGVDDAGHDVKFFGATASRYWLWDESADGVVQRGTLTVGVDDTGHDVKLFGATSGKYWLWDESADGVVAVSNLQQTGTLTVGVDDTGHDVKLFGATSGSFLLWDESADALLLTDSTPIQIGDAQDLTLYHDGTNSYITNKTGALKIATETSGIALTIGHTTSETTVADNLTVTGTATITGGQVVFPATNVATTNANTLDDYQEGTWTPAFASSGATITNGSTNGGHYTKIGRQCFFQGSVGTGGSMSGGTAANGVTVSLPLTSAGHQTGESGYNTVQIKPWLSVYTWGGDTPTLGRVNTSAAYFTLYYQDSVDSYMIPLRFDDLADDVNSPRNLTYFSGMFTVEA